MAGRHGYKMESADWYISHSNKVSIAWRKNWHVDLLLEKI